MGWLSDLVGTVGSAFGVDTSGWSDAGSALSDAGSTFGDAATYAVDGGNAVGNTLSAIGDVPSAGLDFGAGVGQVAGGAAQLAGITSPESWGAYDSGGGGDWSFPSVEDFHSTLPTPSAGVDLGSSNAGYDVGATQLNGTGAADAQPTPAAAPTNGASTASTGNGLLDKGLDWAKKNPQLLYNEMTAMAEKMRAKARQNNG